MNVDDLRKLASNLPLSDPARAGLEWAAGEIERLDKVINDCRDFANNSIYLNDRHDYRSALWDICEFCGMQNENIGVKYMCPETYNQESATK